MSEPELRLLIAKLTDHIIALEAAVADLTERVRRLEAATARHSYNWE